VRYVLRPRIAQERPELRPDGLVRTADPALLVSGFFAERLPRGGTATLLFERYRLVEGLSAKSAARYQEANHLTRRYCRWLEARYLRRSRPGELTREARRFWRLGRREKLETIAALH
jgi:hypothetical protein